MSLPNRVSDQTRYLGMVYQYNSLLQQQMDLMNQISSGIRLQSADQDPVATALSEQTNTQDAQMTQDQTNINEATSFASQTENAINTAMSTMQQANELAVEANDATQTPTALQQIGTEVNQMLNGMLATANSQYNNRNLFGGSATSTATPPFVATTDPVTGLITGVNYQPNPPFTSQNFDALSTVAAPGVTVQYNLLGANNPATGNTNFGVFQNGNAGGVDIFQTLITFRDDLNSDNTGNLSTDLQNIQAAVSQLNTATTMTGTAQQRLTNQQTANDNTQTTLGTTLSKEEDTDMAAAISQLNLLQTSYQAALKVSAQINQVSLLNYI